MRRTIITAIAVIGLLYGVNINAQVTAVKKSAPVASKVAVKVAPVKKVIVDDFEAKEITGWNPRTMEWKDGAIEETIADAVKLSLVADKKLIKSGKQSLKFEYIPATAADAKFARLTKRLESKEMGGNNTISFYVNVESGSVNVGVELFDSTTWKKWGITEPITLNKKGWNKITINQSKFPIQDGWDKINIIQFILKGKFTAYLDDIEFEKSGK